jgi:hypothetical protein
MVPMASIDVLSDGQEWEFFKKGKANAVYRYNGNVSKYKDKLLRLRLSNQNIQTEQVHQFIDSKIRPLLADVIEMELVQVDFRKEKLLNDGFGLLMPAHFTEHSTIVKKDKYFQVFESQGRITLELKPKWLIKNKYGCRNCANHNYKHGELPSLCILSLLDENSIEDSLIKIFEDHSTRQKFSNYFKSKDSILHKLRDLQTEITLESLASEDEVDEKLSIQMTLRDVSIFLALHDGEFSVAVTDVDPKSVSKWHKWKEHEMLLVERHLYTAH